MTAQWALTTAVPKPWGRASLAPWSLHRPGAAPLGEIWFRPADAAAAPTALRLKLLFTSEMLSIQVHPDDAMARAMGLPEGKSEAWYILDADATAQVAIGLRVRAEPRALEAAVRSGRIGELIAWKDARRDDGFRVPAGTVHALGAGLIVAEVQQNCDVTFRLSDPGRERALHLDEGIAALRPARHLPEPKPRPLGPGRTLVLSDPHFVLERLDLPPRSAWRLQADRESWVLVIAGILRFAGHDGTRGEALLVESDAIVIEGSEAGVSLLVAYPGQIQGGLLSRLKHPAQPALALGATS
jgi:mannose-6-phosphate isomerase